MLDVGERGGGGDGEGAVGPTPVLHAHVRSDRALLRHRRAASHHLRAQHGQQSVPGRAHVLMLPFL